MISVYCQPNIFLKTPIGYHYANHPAKSVDCIREVVVKSVRKPRFRSVEEMRQNAGRYWEDRRDVASTYVLRPRLGIKCPGFRMVQKKDLE